MEHVDEFSDVFSEQEIDEEDEEKEQDPEVLEKKKFMEHFWEFDHDNQI